MELQCLHCIKAEEIAIIMKNMLGEKTCKRFIKSSLPLSSLV